MVLSLENPVGINFLKDWPAQNAENCDLIDAYAGPCLTSHSLQSYTPSLTASVTNPGLGTGGTLLGKYYKIFDQVYVWGEWRFGTGFSIGDGQYRVSLPFPAKTNLQVSNPFTTAIPVGTGVIFDASSDPGSQPVITCLSSPDYVTFLIRNDSGAGSRSVRHDDPIVWAGGSPGDGMLWSARYQRVP